MQRSSEDIAFTGHYQILSVQRAHRLPVTSVTLGGNFDSDSILLSKFMSNKLRVNTPPICSSHLEVGIFLRCDTPTRSAEVTCIRPHVRGHPMSSRWAEALERARTKIHIDDEGGYVRIVRVLCRTRAAEPI